jgi:hypothetical protein
VGIPCCYYYLKKIDNLCLPSQVEFKKVEMGPLVLCSDSDTVDIKLGKLQFPECLASAAPLPLTHPGRMQFVTINNQPFAPYPAIILGAVVSKTTKEDIFLGLCIDLFPNS